MKKILTILATVLTLCSSANAAVTTFTFNNLSNGNLGHSETFNVNGTEITAHAYTYNRLTKEWFQSDIYAKNGALGVKNHSLDNNQIDNFVRYDLLAFDLSPAEAERIRLSSVNGNDEWTIGWDDDLLLPPNTGPRDFFSNSLDGYATGNKNDLTNRWYDFDGSTGQTIYVSAGDFLGPRNDDIRVTALSIETTAAVPEPSTYAMFGTAFGILAFVGYRSRSRKS